MYKKFFHGLSNFMSLEEVKVGQTERTLILKEDSVHLYHYVPLVKNTNKIPVLITYSFVNRPAILDLDEEHSLIKRMLEAGLDIYLIDWGTPDYIDKYCSIDDYINIYIDKCVDTILTDQNIKKVNLLGICQGATLNAIYTALNPKKIQNLISLGMPFDFTIEDGLLFKWNKFSKVDEFVEGFGLIPGSLITSGILMVNPYEYIYGRYMQFLNTMDDNASLKYFLRLDKWLNDSPDQPGEMYKDFMKNLYAENKLVKNKLVLGDRLVDMKNIKMPVLCLNGGCDKIVPPSSTRPFINAIGSTDKIFVEYPVDHIDLFISPENNKDMVPFIYSWLKNRSK
jgi:polyhydroxyalkanoate synthase